jgi:hypothetical protein
MNFIVFLKFNFLRVEEKFPFRPISFHYVWKFGRYFFTKAIPEQVNSLIWQEKGKAGPIAGFSERRTGAEIVETGRK